MLVVLALLGIIITFGMVAGMDAYRSHNYRSEQDLLLGILQKARSRAMANINQKPHGVYIHVQASPARVEYILFQGSAYAGRTQEDTGLDVVFPGNPAFVAGGITEVVFGQLTGRPNVTGSITLDDGTRPPINIGLNHEGQINPH